MIKTFTKTISFFVVIILFVLTAFSAQAQYNITTVKSPAFATAMTKDAAGNIYTIECPTRKAGGGQIVKYAAGTNTRSVIYSGREIASNDTVENIANDHGTGIAVDSHGNIFFEPAAGSDDYFAGAIIKLTNNSGTYTASTYISGNLDIGYFTGLAIDASDNMYVFEANQNDVQPDGWENLQLAKYAAGTTSNPQVLYNGFETEGSFQNGAGTITTICAIAVDPMGNVYAADWFNVTAGYGGFIEKFTKNGSSYTASQLENNAYCQALACDATGNLYAMQSSSANTFATSLVKFANGAGAPTTLTSGFSGNYDYWCNGLAVVSPNNIYAINGSDNGTNVNAACDVVQVNPSTTISSLTSNANTSSSSITYTATFAAAVSGLTASDFSLATTGAVSGASIASVTGSGTSWTITVNTGSSGDGTVQLIMNSTSGVSPLVSNLPSSGTAVNVTRIVPTVTSITASSPSNANAINATSVTYTVTFNEPVTGVNSNDFIPVTQTGSTSTNGLTVTQVTASTYQVTINGIFGTGKLRLYFFASAHDVKDQAGNVATANFTAGDDYTFDFNPPAVSISAPSVTSINSTATVTYTATWSDINGNLNTNSINLTPSQLQFSGSGYSVDPGNISITGSGSTRTISITGVTGDGSMSFKIPAGTATDNPGNSATASNVSTAVIVDNIAPVVTVSAPSVSYANSNSAIVYTVTVTDDNFNTSSENNYTPLTAFINTHFTGSARLSSVTLGSFTQSGNSYSTTVTYNGTPGDGTLGISIPAGIFTDRAGNSSAGVDMSPLTIVDNTPPAVASITSTSPTSVSQVTNATSLDYKVTFSEGVTGVSSSAFNVTTTGNITNTGVTVTPIAGNQYDVTVNGLGGGTGTVRLDLANTAGITDTTGNALAAAYTGGDTYNVDYEAPTVLSIVGIAPTSHYTNATAITYAVTFSEPVVGVSPAGFNFTNLFGNVSYDNITVSPVNSSVYNVTINNVSGKGTARLDFMNTNLAVQDSAGNTEQAFYQSGDTYTIDTTIPTVQSITATTPLNTTPTKASSLVYTVTFNKGVLGLSGNAFTATSVTGNVTSGSISIQPIGFFLNKYAVTVNNVSGDGTLRLDFTNTGSAVKDSVGNVATAFSGGDVYTIDNTAPVVAGALVYKSNNSNQLEAVPGNTVTLSFTASEPIQTPTVSIGNQNITVTNTSGNDWVATYQVTPADPIGRLSFSLTMTDIAGNSNTYDDSSAGDDLEVVSTDATLSNLQVNHGILSPVFGPATTTYTVSEPNGTRSIDVTPTLNKPGSTITVNGTSVISGSPVTVPLNVGNNTITVATTAQDGETTDTYTITATRAPSANANLAGLTLTAGTISPRFDQNTTSYNTTVGNNVTLVGVKAALADTNATMTINGLPATNKNIAGPISLNVGDNVIPIVVTAQDGSTAKTYNVTVTRTGSDNNYLAGLTTSAGTLNPAFDPGNDVYNVSVSNLVSSIQVKPTLVDTTATIMVNGNPVANASFSNSIPLPVGFTTIQVTVTAQDGNEGNYDLNVTRAGSGNNFLAGLALSKGTISPAFDPNTTNYTASVDYYTTSIMLKPALVDNTAMVSVAGNVVTSGSFSPPVSLLVGNNPIIVTVAAQDGSVKQYTVTVTRSGASQAQLAGLKLSSGTLSPAFTYSGLNYTASVANSISSITVTPTLVDINAIVIVNGARVTSGTASDPIALNVGPNTISVVTFAQDNTTTKTYTVVVTRAGATQALLSKLQLSKGSLSPAFTYTGYNYSANVLNNVPSITVTPTEVDNTASVTVNGQSVASGSASQPINLNVGQNTITVVSKAQDGTTTRTYTVVVTRGGASQALLSNLQLSNGTLSPTFTYTGYNYTASVQNSVSSVTVTPTEVDKSATVTVNGQPVANISASQPINLNIGNNTITVVSTAQDGTTKATYTVVVTRGPVPPSSQALLAKLHLSKGTLSPTFAYTTFDYTASVGNTVSSLAVAASLVDPTATMKVNGTPLANNDTTQAIALNVGNNTITITTKAQDSTTTKTYKVVVNRAGTGGGNNVVLPAVTQNIKPDFAENVVVHQAVSPNGDGQNDVLTIDNIQNYPDNKLQIINGNGELVYEAKGYDNASRVFDGHSNKTGHLLLQGTYFYSLDYKVNGENKHKTGYIVLKY